MKALLSNPHMKRAGAIIFITLMVIVMTGPEGNGAQPTYAFVGSFSQHLTFFGLFNPQRWVVFAILALIIVGIIALVKTSSRAWRNRTSFRGAAYQRVSGAYASIGRRSHQKSTRLSFYVIALVAAIALPHVITDQSWQTDIVQQVAVYLLL